MLQTETKAIGNHRYRVRQLGASEGRRMLIRLMKVLGPVLAALLRSAKPPAKTPTEKVEEKAEAETSPQVPQGWSLMDTKLEDLAGALEKLAEKISEPDLEYLCSTFGHCTELVLPDGKVRPLTLEEQELHFAGKYGDMFKWLAFALETNYSDFFGKSSALAGALARLDGEGQGQRVS